MKGKIMEQKKLRSLETIEVMMMTMENMRKDVKNKMNKKMNTRDNANTDFQVVL